ncbi:ATP-binding protein [Herbihabitans rhizosphaerae]|uniref:ATP-binding protein n=1 Tax=Herbihabitans rhizosphaerae TaxID=1872711 RepID=UPI001F5FE37E|nr:LuxR C-terminal-related transcriptional regulator [Herbihabitans rhizosphaerae]
MTTCDEAAVGSRDDAMPLEATTYVGRRAEIAEVRRLLGATSTVTLTGPGGVGKSRLARRAVCAVRGMFPDGVVVVKLAELREPALLVSTVAARLGLGDRAAIPMDVIVDHLHQRRMLLLLDNCEHLVDACAGLVDTLVSACPGLVVLATSRQSLGVTGERIMPVPPLEVPQPGGAPADLERYDAVRLLLDRATAVVPSFAITEQNAADVITLCRKLEGLPLAIELAAVRMRVLSVRQLIDRLDKRFAVLTGGNRGGPSRHETMRSLVDWSHELCTEPERLLWARASVFSGGFDLDAAERVCSGDGLDSRHVLDVIDALIDKSILVREEYQGLARYRMLETIRLYGEERLRAADDEQRMRRRHRDWCVELTGRFEAEWIGPDQARWVDMLIREHPNLRRALDFCASDPDEAAVGLSKVLTFKEYWIIRGLTEGRIWLDRLLDVAADDAPGRAHALWSNAFLALVQGDIDAYETHLSDAERVAERTGDEKAVAYVHHVRAYHALIGNDMPNAVELFGKSVAMFRAQGDEAGELWSTYNYGLAISLSGELDRGRRVLRDCIERLTSRGEVFWRSWALWSLAAAEYLRGDVDEAAKAGFEVLRLQRRVHDRVILAFAVTVLAGCAAHNEQPRRAARLLGVAATAWRSFGASPRNYAAFVEPVVSDTELVAGRLGFDQAANEFALGAAMPAEEAMAYVLADGEPAEETAPKNAQGTLTRRENQIAELVAEGLTNKQIAEKLGIARRTAESHVDHILTKLSFTNRAQIAAWVASRRN